MKTVRMIFIVLIGMIVFLWLTPGVGIFGYVCLMGISDWEMLMMRRCQPTSTTDFHARQ